ncbi:MULTISPECIES: disulfide bond formation protein B [Pseudomonas]|uniref:Membrane protein n=2 Tax=Pseudomonas fluorescens TaxID=294 RepID=C3K420_PSEFS|nr:MULTISPECIES: disulfide bond formation protein B [Pseudomonas]KJZ56819.1 disulfide bond formation protein B [Pseudomonas marginalis]KJZ59686.1 disulfide bond formation protein B [Pseudomonas marginalis]MBZ6454483.1 disulfide bond formation protein B [Pseudomonas fluorescens group sp.]MBZ6461279.1 disulfide bond formation protein B [Pseudomonas fluorescens group sp.]MBZ6466468.1 disulfide bond formation protein B [Pseudomonas fluorescens group sp.]
MSLAPSRSLFFFAFLAGTLTLGASFYLEFGASLRPCFLCQMQRGFLAAFTLNNLAATLHNPKRSVICRYGLASMSFALLGAITAVRQVLLQNAAPDQTADCWPSLHYMIENLSFWQALQLTVKGSVDCMDINWTLFDLSLPEWSLLFFLGMLILGFMQFSRLFLSQHLRPLGR